jgi:hypothetical protein
MCLLVYDHFPGASARDSQFQIKGTSGGLLQDTGHECSSRDICLRCDTRCTGCERRFADLLWSIGGVALSF